MHLTAQTTVEKDLTAIHEDFHLIRLSTKTYVSIRYHVVGRSTIQWSRYSVLLIALVRHRWSVLVSSRLVMNTAIVSAGDFFKRSIWTCVEFGPPNFRSIHLGLVSVCG